MVDSVVAGTYFCWFILSCQIDRDEPGNWWPGETLDWGGEGVAILRAQQQKDFCVIPYFLLIADYEKAFLYVFKHNILRVLQRPIL